MAEYYSHCAARCPFSRLPFHLLAPTDALANAAPEVVPLLREWQGGSGSFTLTGNAQIRLASVSASQLRATAQTFQQDLALETGWMLTIVISDSPGTGNFFLTLQTRDSSLGSEGYLFDVGDAVTINALTSGGIFYGTRTALQILGADAAHSQIPRGSARDYPHYAERGFMLDVGRKFVPLNVLEDYVRMMAWYKFNDFQLHLNDNAPDGGSSPDWQHQYAAFRLDSPAFPGLAAPDGSYSEQQIRDLVQFAQRYAVTITPEIDTPAHALALTQYRPALASPTYSKEFLDLANPATYTLVDALWRTFLPWFATDQVNMGMDEYATQAADAYRTYVNYYDTFLRQQGKTVRMWGSLTRMVSSIPIHTDIVIEDWNNSWADPVEMLKEGFSLINANDALLYIVPHANYYHDYLDTRQLYENWNPSIFSLTNPALNVPADDPHLLGGTFAVWNDKYPVTSVDDISQRIAPALPVLGQDMWDANESGPSYQQFERLVQAIGVVPGVNILG